LTQIVIGQKQSSAHLTLMTLTIDPVILKSKRFLCCPGWTDVWTKFEEGRSRHSWVIDRKRKGYRPKDQPTDRL